jgi:hypothetical protein
MANPVVSVSPSGPINLASGQSIEVAVFATDADNQSAPIDYPVRDLAGNVSVFRQFINLSDPLSADAPIDVNNVGFVIVAIAPQAGELARFRVTAP